MLRNFLIASEYLVPGPNIPAPVSSSVLYPSVYQRIRCTLVSEMNVLLIPLIFRMTFAGMLSLQPSPQLDGGMRGPEYVIILVLFCHVCFMCNDWSNYYGVHPT